MDKTQFQEIFLQLLKDPVLNLESEAIMSHYMEQIPVQDPFRFRAKYLGLRVATLLIDEKGELDTSMLDELKDRFNRGFFLLGPKRAGDSLLYEHIKTCINELSNNPEIRLAIRKFSPPLCHKKAEEAIRETLWPEPIRIPQTQHIRKAALAAWLTPLRQLTGSCFATAPAIFIQKNRPQQFFKDLYDLLSIGQMKRIVGGKEYSVPFSLSSGVADLQRRVSVPFFGLLLALESVDVKLSEEKKKKIREAGPQTVEAILKMVLLDELKLSEEDLRDEEHLARIQMTPLLAKQGAVYFQRPSERAQKIADWRKRLEKASIAFKTITECALLRVWEYSMASFSDVKTEFGRWNLFVGLGLHPDQKDGIGAFLYDQVNEHLQKCQREIETINREYQRLESAMQALESMMQGAQGGARFNQLKAEWSSHSLSANTLIEERNRLIARADSLVQFFSWLIAKYDEKLQEFFQELFDPALHRENLQYDDSPAGFRLVYKHGRADASQWSPIYTKEQYVEFLTDFFSRMENELDLPDHIGKEFFQEITTALIRFIQEDRFIDSAFIRSKQNGRLSPWDYISGGTLQTLLMTYCNRDHPFKEKAIIPKSAEELFGFLTKIESKKPLLMHSPTHAFILYPELMEGKKELKKFQVQKWTEAMQEHLVHRLSEKLPEEEKAIFIHLFRNLHATESNMQFRQNAIDSISSRVPNKVAIVDSALYENALLFTPSEVQDLLKKILKVEIKEPEGTFLGPLDVYEHAKMSVALANQKVIFPEDWDQKIAHEMRKWGVLADVILFADTNWSDWFFGFVHNPVTAHLELWRFNRTATQGFPMNEWKEFLAPENSSSWIILSEPAEYIS